ncbi:MAG: hypothetical protein QOI61_978 [Actinomycetota bacterium]
MGFLHRFSRFFVGAALVGGMAVGINASPARAAIVSASDVAASLTAPTSAGGGFPATGTITNTGAFSQPAGSTLTFAASGGTFSGLPAGCAVSGATRVCTAGALAPGVAQSFTLTVTPNLGSTSVVTTATAKSKNAELNVFPDNANNVATATTNVVFNVSTALSSNPTTVRNGDDTLLTATVTNSQGAQNVTLVVNTGGTYDSQLALPAGCAASGGGATVTCTHAYGVGQTRSFDIAVASPASGSSMTSTATATGAFGGSDSKSTTTGLFADATAFVPNGDHLGNTAPNTVTDFTVALGSAPGLFLDLNEVDINGTLCGTTTCGRYAAEALFPNSGTYSGNNPAKPFLWDISYGQLSCNGNGNPNCTDVLWVIPSGSVVATKIVKCQTYGQATATLTNVNQVCLQNATKSGSNWTFRIALLRDIVIPIIGGVSGQR